MPLVSNRTVSVEESDKMHVITLLIVGFTAVIAAPPHATYAAQRVVGITPTTARDWPQVANILFTWNRSTFEQYCGGTILNNRTVLTAAHCIVTHPVNRFRFRLGSSFASSGGIVRNVADIIVSPFYNARTEDYDIALMRSETTITFDPTMQPAKIACSNYELGDNQVVYGVGWGADRHDGPRPEQLRQVQIWTINQEECALHYSTEDVTITDNMLCAGWRDVGGRDLCQGDSGGPLFHNGVLVGVHSFGIGCGVRFFPSVNVRVSRVADWINANK